MLTGTEQSGPVRSSAWNIVIIGPGGSGKGTQAKRLAETYGLRHLEMGKLLRQAAAEPTDLGRELDRIINREGRLAPLEIAMGIFLREVKKTPPTVGILFDGTPRRIEDSAFWDQELPKLGRAFTHVIVLRVSEAAIINRLAKRRTCSREGTPLILGVDIPNDASPCPRCGAPLVARPDDQPDVVRARLRTYQELTEPIIGLYRERGIVHEVNGDQPIPDVYRDIEASLRA